MCFTVLKITTTYRRTQTEIPRSTSSRQPPPKMSTLSSQRCARALPRRTFEYARQDFLFKSELSAQRACGCRAHRLKQAGGLEARQRVEQPSAHVAHDYTLLDEVDACRQRVWRRNGRGRARGGPAGASHQRPDHRDDEWKRTKDRKEVAPRGTKVSARPEGRC